MDETCERKLNTLNPVAIKLGQGEIDIPRHNTWGIVICEHCNERFKIGPNRIYGSRRTEQDCVKQLNGLLQEDHEKRRSHSDRYELIE